MNRAITFFAALAATATMSFPAFAAEQAAPTAMVHYSDLNLASRDGAEALKDRVARAARRICADNGDMSLARAAQARKCARVAIAKASPQVELALANAGIQVAENRRLSVAAH